MANILDSLKKFAAAITLLTVATFAAIFLFEQMVAAPIKLSIALIESIKTAMIIVSGSIVVFLIRRFRIVMGKRFGHHPAAIFSFFMTLVTIIIMAFTVLDIFQVSATTLLLGGGIVTLVIGLVLSTLVGSTLAGTLVLAANMFRVGDSVLVNNVPGRIEEITTMFTRIRNDMGGEIIIPNTALIQGSIIVTKIPSDDSTPKSRLPYSLGDRVYTTYMNEEGTVKDISPFHTKIILDSGREITFLNTSVIAGSVAIAKVTQVSPEPNNSGKSKATKRTTQS
jgi:small-conductance mechanosensitive channel